MNLSTSAHDCDEQETAASMARRKWKICTTVLSRGVNQEPVNPVNMQQCREWTAHGAKPSRLVLPGMCSISAQLRGAALFSMLH